MEQPDQSLPMPGDGDVYEPSLCLDDDSLLGLTLAPSAEDMAVPGQDADFHTWFNHGLAMLKLGSWQAAREAFYKVISQIPEDDLLRSRSYALLGYSAAKLGKMDEAMESYHTAIKQDKKCIEALSGLACALLEVGNFDEAMSWAINACQVRPNNAALHYNCGNIMHRMNDHAAAIIAFQNAISIDPSLYPAYVNLGVALAGLGTYEEAIEQLDYARVLEPESRRVHTNRGIILARLKRWDDSADAFQSSIKVAPKIGRNYIILSMVEQCRGNFLEAMVVLNKCIDLELEKSKAFHNLGLIHSRLKHHGQAVASYLTAIQFKPDYAKAYQSLGREYGSQNQYEQAEESFRKAVELRPSLVESWMALAELAMIRGDNQEAIELLGNALSHDPFKSEANATMAVLQIELGNRKEAMRCYQILEQQKSPQAATIHGLLHSSTDSQDDASTAG